MQRYVIIPITVTVRLKLGRRTVNVPGSSPNNRRQGSLAFMALLGFPLAIAPTSSVKQRASNPGFVWWERPCLIRAPLIWLTSLITSTVGGQGGQVESSEYRHLSLWIRFNGAMLLINRASPLSSQIYIKMHAEREREVNNGRQTGSLGLLFCVRDIQRAREMEGIREEAVCCCCCCVRYVR